MKFKQGFEKHSEEIAWHINQNRKQRCNVWSTHHSATVKALWCEYMMWNIFEWFKSWQTFNFPVSSHVFGYFTAVFPSFVVTCHQVKVSILIILGGKPLICPQVWFSVCQQLLFKIYLYCLTGFWSFLASVPLKFS